MSNEAMVIVLATLGTAAQLGGVVVVVREIAGDRRLARELIDKRRQWTPEKRGAPAQVSAQQIEMQSTFAPYRVGPGNPIASQIASLVTGHNRLVHETEELVDGRTAAMLGEIDHGDKELRDVLRYLLRGSVIERVGGVVAILVGLMLSLAASLVGAVG